MLDALIIAFRCAVVAYVYSEILIKEGHILHSWWQWLNRKLVVKREVPVYVPPEVLKDFPGEFKTTEPVYTPRKILKAVGGCPLCTAGQFTLWVSLFLSLTPYLPYALSFILCAAGNLIFTICAAILMVLLLDKLIQKWGTH